MTTMTPTILITGATGKTGSELSKLLNENGIPFRALVRRPEAAAAVKQYKMAEVVQGDLADEASLLAALTGINNAFLVTDSSEHAEMLQTNFVDACVRAGVKHIVKLSQYGADLNSPVRFLRYHAAVEQKIVNSGIAYTFIRANLFMQVFYDLKHTIESTGKLYASSGNGAVSVVDTRDIAAVAYEALTDARHMGKTYTITGPEALSHQAIAEILSRSLKRKIEYVDVPPFAMLETLKKIGFPVWQAEGIVEDYAHYSRNEAAEVSPDVENITGNKPRTFQAFADSFALLFTQACL